MAADDGAMRTAGGKPVRVLYFASIRERASVSAEEVILPPSVTTVEALIAWLKARGGGPATALAEARMLRCAVNQEHVDLAAPVTAGDEVAFFPPVTGG